MIKNRGISAGAASSKYYDKEGYYTPGSNEARAASEWFGRGAKDAGLVGEVDGDTFTRLLEGHAPDGQVMGVMRGGARKHRHGIDLTMNAPKEVSILALVFGDARVVAAHDKVVRDITGYVEDKLMMTRVGRSGEIEVTPAPNVIAGLFRHETSRELDPHLHTHAVIANMVKIDLGDKYRAIHNDVIAEHAMMLTQLYQSGMLKEMRDLGFDAALDRKGFLEIPALKGLKDPYSKRSLQIVQSLAERGLEDTGKNRQIAALMTRSAKTVADRGELTPLWEKQADLEGWDKELRAAFVEAARKKAQGLQAERGGEGSGAGDESRPGAEPATDISDDPALVTRSSTKTNDVRAAVDFAIRHISEREAIYHEADLKTVALRRLEVPDIRAIDQEVATLVVNEKRLFSVVTVKGRYFSDSETLAAEREVIKSYRASVRAPGVQIEKTLKYRLTSSRSPEASLNRRLARTTLTAGQKDAIKTSLLGKGRYGAVQGYAGTGKTFMLAKLSDYAERYGFRVEGVAPTNAARVKLNEVIPGAQTITSFLLNHKNGKTPATSSKRILVVDEAAMVSTKDFRDLMIAANAQGIARVIFQGDIKQLEAVGAGIPYKQLQQAGMQTALMDDIRRQENELSRAAVLHAMRGEVRQAFEKVGRVTADENVLQHVADTWLALSKSKRKTTGVLVLTNGARKDTNDLIREGLKADGSLGKTSITLPTIDPVNLTRAAAGDAGSYRIGDTVLSVGQLKSNGIQPYDLFKVVGINPDENRITFNVQGAEDAVEIQLGQNTQAADKLVAFEDAPREFATGDYIKFNLADRDANILKGERGTITKLTKNYAEIHLDTNEKTRIDLSSFAARGLDHGYALTAHAFQGHSIQNLIVGMFSTERLATQKALYVQLSRVVDQAQIITDDVSKLIGTISRQTGESMDALAEVTRARISELFKTAGRSEAQLDGEKTAKSPAGIEGNAALTRGEKSDRGDLESPDQNDPQSSTKKDADLSRDDQAKGVGKVDDVAREEWDKDAALKEIEKGWDKINEDRARTRGERSR